MRKSLLLVVAISAIIGISGCSSSPKEETKEPKTETTTKPAEEKEVVKAVDWSKVIPDPKGMFPDGKITILETKPNFFYRVENYKEGEYEAYLEEAKKMGFTDIKYQGGEETYDTFMAYDDAHEYYLEIPIDYENKFIDIICNVVKDE